MKTIRAFAVFVLFALSVVPAFPQSLPNLALLRLSYTVNKRTKPPQGDVKDKIDAIDKELIDATRQGKNGEVRRLLAKGLALLNGNDWSDAMDYKASLVLRSDRVFVDSSRPYVVRMEQIYSSSLQLDHSLSAHLTLCKLKAPAGPGGGGGGPQAGDVVKDLGVFSEVSRDLLESPFIQEVTLDGVADGIYLMQAEVLDGDHSLGTATLRVSVQKGLDESLAKLEKEAAIAPEAIRADVRFPADRIRNVNLGRIEMGNFDPAKEIAAAEQTLADAKNGKDPFIGRTGDMKRHYYLKTADEIMPYRLYVPAACAPPHTCPLVVALHGLGGTEDSMFSPLYNVSKFAEQHGFIAVAPLGYRIDAGYGAFRAPGQPSRRSDLSEEDVMDVLHIVRTQYKVDDNRIYLMGHSMGGFGTWAMAAAHPEIWAALGPISGGGSPASVDKFKAIPEIVVHGDADTVVPVNSSRVMVDAMKKDGVDVKYIEVPGGTHMSVPAPNMAAIFDFFDAHKKGANAVAGTASGH